MGDIVNMGLIITSDGIKLASKMAVKIENNIFQAKIAITLFGTL